MDEGISNASIMGPVNERTEEPMGKFKVDERNNRDPEGWRIAMRCDVETNMDQVKEALKGFDSEICTLDDGTVAGADHGYEITGDERYLWYKLLINCLEFKVDEYHNESEDGWRMASVHEVEANMGKVEEAFIGLDSRICALVDGTVAGPGYGHEITHEVKELDHKLLINLRNKSAIKTKAKFKVDEYHKEDEDGWRMARVYEVEANMGQVEKALSGLDRRICALVDGTVAGPGYGHEITHEVKELDHKLLINWPTEFRVLEHGYKVEDGWRIPAVREVQAHMDKVMEVLCDRDEVYFCALLDGRVDGPAMGYDFEYKSEREYSELGYKLVTNLPAPPYQFDVADYKCCEKAGWRWARLGEVRANLAKVQETLREKEWHICCLLEGWSISGPGYDFKYSMECKEPEHKLIVKGGPELPPVEFRIKEYDEGTEGHWRMARIYDVKANEEKVHEVLADKERHICALVDGSVSGPGYGYEIGEEVKELEYQLIVNY